MTAIAALEVLSNSNGSVALGWVAHHVYYARFVGSLSAELGRAHLARLENALSGTHSLAYFADASALGSYDLLARSALVRLILKHRGKLPSVVMLALAGGITARTEAFAAALGGAVQIVHDPAEFEKLLARAAPRWRKVIEPAVAAQASSAAPRR